MNTGDAGDVVSAGDAVNAGDGGGLPRDAGPGDVSGAARGSLAELAASCPGTLAVCVPGLLGVNEDVVLPLASTGKVLLLAALARDVASGALDPAEPVALLDEDYAGGSGLLTELSARRWTIGDLAVLTASVSDNTATNALLRRLGLARVDAAAGALGLAGTRVHDRIREPRLPAHPPAFATGTARELAGLMRSVAYGREPWQRLLLGWMACNTDRGLVPALLPHEPEDREPPRVLPYAAGVWVANKTGTDAGTRADVGVIAAARWEGYAVLAHGPEGSEQALVRAVRQAGVAVAATVTGAAARA
ncbi:serine hydrolase [Microbispora triticiradicis]|uniref:serine hydrolase n=1 Tax=Microbispora TaxID=2005 RepID=UPI001FCBBCB1|nr:MULTISPECIES: serine hydrolase [Microbispora]